jgi:dienelactone hydrolase
MSSDGYARSRRFVEQRWLVDAAIRLIGVDWDQGRSRYLAQPCGSDAQPDFARLRERIKKFADIHREFAAAARAREEAAEAAAGAGDTAALRQHAYTAAVLWGGAQWPLFGNTPLNLAYGEHKVACYRRYIEVAPHPIERVEIPFGATTLPAYLHVPPAAAAPVPCIVQVGGMDSFKEHLVAIDGDPLLASGVARLTFDGPGQGESLTRGLWVTATNFMDAGLAVVEWLASRPDIDATRIGVSGVSFGSFWATQVAAAVQGLVGAAVMLVVHESGMHDVFESVSPTFKSRFMYMSGYAHDEAAFDSFARTMSLDAVAPDVHCPFLVVAGEEDDLSPIDSTWELLRRVTGPKRLVLYQGERHGISGGPAATYGPDRDATIVEWFTDRLAGREMADELHFVDVDGRLHRSPLFAEDNIEDIVAGIAPRTRGRPQPDLS